MTSLNENQSLDRENEILLELFEQAEGLLYQFTYHPKSNTYGFPFFSKGAEQLLELNFQQVKKNPDFVFARIYPRDAQKMYEILEESLQNLSHWNCDFRISLPVKGIRWVRANGNVKKDAHGNYLWNGHVYDITEQKNIEHELLESRQRLQFALEGSQDGVWDWNVKTDVAYYSDTSIRMLGFDSDEIQPTAHFWNDRVHKDDQEAYYADIERHLNGISPYYSNEHRILCKDNTYKWILDRGKVIQRDKEGKPVRVIGTHSDITSRKLREQEFLRTIEVIENQNDRLLNFAHIVSHNLRTYSGNFESLLTLANDSDSINEKLEYFQYLEEVSSGLSETIDHLTKIISIQTKVSQKKELISIHNLIEKVKVILGKEIKEKKAIVANNVPEDIHIEYIPAYAESILFNLISNGIKYKYSERSPIIVLDTITLEDQLILKVSDNGMGIDLNKYGDKLFGMYKTFHGNKDAKGIGLFITKNQLVSMGDTIVVRSEVNKGTTFQITFNNKFSKV